MKKYLLVAALAFTAIACSDKNTCKIKGTVKAKDYLTDSTLVLVSHMNRESVDTVRIKKGSFTYKCEVDSTKLSQLMIVEGNELLAAIQFIPEAGTMTLVFDEHLEAIFEGGRINKAQQEYEKKCQEQMDQYSLVAGTGDADKSEAFIKTIIEYNKSVYEANKGNFLALEAFYFIMPTLSLEEMEKYMAEAEPFIAQEETFQKTLDGLRVQADTGEGSFFLDFSGTTPDGKSVKLSDYVGKGKYTLVDFWASWCGPCKGEMPNLKELYKTYGPKGLTVVSVAVWDGDNSESRKVIKELGMKWNQIFTGEDKSATEIYGISSIPHIILFSPDGKIVKRNLRGEELKEYIKGLF